MNKKSHNPFKMIGSYLGMIGGFAIPIDVSGNVGTFFGTIINVIKWDLLTITDIGIMTVSIFFALLGFLIGWLIQSLFRSIIYE